MGHLYPFLFNITREKYIIINMDSNINHVRFAVSVITLLLIIYFYYRDIIGYSPRKQKCVNGCQTVGISFT